MKKLLIGTLALITLNSFAQSAGKEGGNGGQTVYQGSNAYLRDLVEKNNCIWKNYQSVLTEAPLLKTIISDMAILNPSFSLRMEDEIRTTGYCFTTKRLPYLQYNNSDDIHIFSNQEYDQVAINDSGIVFIDVNIFSKMNQENRAYLFIHEAGHGLYDQKEPRSSREPRLREFLMNLFEQLPTLVRTRNYDGFNLLIEKAKFSALENVIGIDHEAYRVVLLNEPHTSLKKKALSLKALNYGIESSTPKTQRASSTSGICFGHCFDKKEKTIIRERVYGKTLINNIKIIQDEMRTELAKLVRDTRRASAQDLQSLIDLAKKTAPYFRVEYQEDQAIASPLVDMLLHTLQTKDLSQYNEDLKDVFYFLNINEKITEVSAETKSLPSGLIAKNYDAAYGEGFFANLMAPSKHYLNALLFGKELVLNYSDGKFLGIINDAGVTHIQLASFIPLEQREKGLVNDPSSEISKYLLQEVRFNSTLKMNLKEILQTAINSIKGSNFSIFSGEYGVGDILYTTKRSGKKVCKAACLSDKQRKEELKRLENLIQILN